MAKKKALDEKMIKRQIEKQAEKLEAEHGLERLRQMYQHMTGKATRARSKAKLAAQIAVFLVTGDGPTAQAQEPAEPEEPLQAQAPATVGPDVAGEAAAQDQAAQQKLEQAAQRILARVQQTWEHLDKLAETKKNQLAEFKETISRSRGEITDVLKEDQLSPDQKLIRLEGHWRVVVSTEAKATETRRDFNERIKAARQTMRHEMDNTKQLQLFG
jgi:hypothetical protein